MYYSGDGPVWYRGWALEDENKVCRDVDDVLERIGVRRLIMGHTPTFTVSHTLLNLIDIGSSDDDRTSSQDVMVKSSSSTQVGSFFQSIRGTHNS